MNNKVLKCVTDGSTAAVLYIDAAAHVKTDLSRLGRRSDEMDAVKRARKKNWTDSEQHLLLDLVNDHYAKLFGKFSDTLTGKTRRIFGHPFQTTSQKELPTTLEKKITQMNSDNIKDYSELKKKIRGPGGEPPPEPSNRFMERILAIFGGDENPKSSIRVSCQFL